jgi:ribonuclease HI
MHFHGASSRTGVGAGIVFISPKGEFMPYSYILEFDCTNNTIESEDLLLGLELAREMKVIFKEVGDSDLIVQQLSNLLSQYLYLCKALHKMPMLCNN